MNWTSMLKKGGIWDCMMWKGFRIQSPKWANWHDEYIAKPCYLYYNRGCNRQRSYWARSITYSVKPKYEDTTKTLVSENIRLALTSHILKQTTHTPHDTPIQNDGVSDQQLQGMWKNDLHWCLPNPPKCSREQFIQQTTPREEIRHSHKLMLLKMK